MKIVGELGEGLSQNAQLQAEALIEYISFNDFDSQRYFTGLYDILSNIPPKSNQTEKEVSLIVDSIKEFQKGNRHSSMIFFKKAHDSIQKRYKFELV